jgi:hypothetical protein
MHDFESPGLQTLELLSSEPQEIKSCDTKSKGNATPNAANSGCASAPRRRAGRAVEQLGSDDEEEAGVGRFGSIGYPYCPQPSPRRKGQSSVKNLPRCRAHANYPSARDFAQNRHKTHVLCAAAQRRGQIAATFPLPSTSRASPNAAPRVFLNALHRRRRSAARTANLPNSK